MPVPSAVPDWARRLLPRLPITAVSVESWASLRPRIRQRIVVLATTKWFHAVWVGLCLGVAGLARGRRGSFDHLKSTLSLARGSTRIAGRPMNLSVEPTNACNLGCPVCETGDGTLGRTTGHMTLEEFQTIIGKVGEHTNTLMFYFMGEPFLNPSAYEMIRYAKDTGIPFIDTCTNGDFVDPDRLVTCGLDRVSFQIGGMTQRTHETYRVRSQLDRVIANLQESLRLRNERGSNLTIESGFILMKHNEHEVATFQQKMEEIGVDHAVVIDPCVRTVEQGQTFLPTDRRHWIYDEAAFAKGKLRLKIYSDNVCPWIHYSMAVHVNGDVVPCCRDPRGDEVMGNLLEQDLEEIWNGSLYRSLRERIQRDQGAVEICRLCSSYPVSRIR